MKWLTASWNNLKTRLVGMFLLFSVLLVFSVSLLIHNQADDALQVSVENRLTNVALLKEAELNRWAESNKSTLRALAQRPLMREYSVQLIKNENSSDADRIRALIIQDHLLPSLAAAGGFQDISLIRAEDGLILASSNPDLEGKYRESKEFFLQGREGTYLGRPEFFLGDERPVLHISTPLQSPQGETVAVLAGHTDLDEISKIMTQHREFSRTQDTYLINKANLMVTESRHTPDSAHRIFVFTDGAEQCLKGNSGSGLYLDYRQISVVGIYRWLPAWQMCLLTEQDEAEAFGLISELTRSTLGIGLLVTMLGVAGGILFSRSITQPLRELSRGVEEISRGNLDPSGGSGYQRRTGRAGQEF
ncbi:MAG: cache domain-containing protein [Anaerolineales bacterium]|nr:cache domain-containing protein [Anaerolineales bacterium]